MELVATFDVTITITHKINDVERTIKANGKLDKLQFGALINRVLDDEAQDSPSAEAASNRGTE